MKVLIVRVGAMGDVVHALHGVAALKAARPEWDIDWVVDPRWEPLLLGDDAPVVRRVQLADTQMWKRGPLSWRTLRSVAGLRRSLRAEQYDAVVDMQGTLRSAVIGKFAAAPERFGYADPREAMAKRFYRTEVLRTGTHVVEQGANLLGAAFGMELQPEGFALPLIGSAERWAAQEKFGVERPLCVLGAGGGWGAKQWPAENFGALGAELAKRGLDVVVNAPRKDDAKAESVAAASGGAVRVVVCHVAGMVAMLRRARLFVGGDTGPMHVAAALGVPVVALFGPTDPARNGPWGLGAKRVLRHASSATSYRKVEEIDGGLGRLGVDAVLAACDELLRV